MIKAKFRCVTRERKTSFVEIFRTTPTNTVCPNFYVLSHANGCTFQPHCEYCYLKSTFWHQNEQVAFSNVDKMVRDVRRWIAKDNLESYILNTGNLSDSLAFEGVRPMAPALVEEFRVAERLGKKHTLLLLTKGGVLHCKCLFKIEPCANVVMSFSVNTPEAAAEYERGAAKPDDRMEAARRLKAQGWRMRIRLDPMILGFDYSELLRQVRELAPERVTLGGLRAEKNLAKFVREGLFEGLVPDTDGKGMARYPRTERVALYRQAVEALRDICPIGLCEETRDIWEELGLKPDDKPCNCGS